MTAPLKMERNRGKTKVKSRMMSPETMPTTVIG